jgi:hypothetical protein
MDQVGEGEQISFTNSQAHKRQFENLNWFPLPSLFKEETPLKAVISQEGNAGG